MKTEVMSRVMPIVLIMLMIFTATFAVAQDIEATATESAETTAEIEVSEVTNATEIGEIASDVEALTPEALAPAAKQKYAGLARVTIAEGWVVNDARTDAQLIRALWTSARYIAAEPSAVKNITKKYKGNASKIKEELGKLTEEIVSVAAGKLSVGFGEKKEVYKLLKKEFTNTSVSFYVLQINTNISTLKNATDEEITAASVGELKADATKYPSLTLWKGTLKLESGNYKGTWDISAVSHSRVIEKEKVIKAVAKGERRGFWARLFRRG